MRPIAGHPRDLNGFDMAATAVLCVAAIVGPLLLGGTGAEPRFAIECAMAAAAMLWASAAPRPLWLMAAPAATAAICLIQTIPLPSALLEACAPLSFNAWQVVRGGLANSWATISMDPGATAIGIRRLFLALSTIAMVADLALRPKLTNALTAAMAVSGLIICALGLAFTPKEENRLILGFYDLSGPSEYWKTPIHEPGQTAAFSYPAVVKAGAVRYFADDWVAGDRIGPYIISNHFAGALVLTIPAAAAIWLLATGGRVPKAAQYAFLSLLYAVALYAVAIKAKSRAGTGALTLALMGVTALVVKPPWLKIILGWGTAVAGVGILCISATMYGLWPNVDKVFPDFLQPSIQRVLQDKRSVASHVALRMFSASPVFGTGIDTYGNLYPRFAKDDQPWYFAHNDYAQLLAETGLLGMGLAAAFAFFVIRTFVRQARSTTPSEWLPTAGAWAAVAGIAGHSLFDWNMHVPANAFLTCLALGIALADRQQPVATRVPIAGRLWARIGFTLAIFLTIGTLARDAQSQRVVGTLRRALATARIAAGDPSKPAPYEQLKTAVREGKEMFKWDPKNATLPMLIGQAYLHSATELQPIDDVTACLDAANDAFATARSRSAICRGLPED